MERTGAALAPSARPYFPELDGVRAIAALMVMAFHFSQDWWGRRFMIFGQTGVDLFFVLSGFLITTLLLQAPQGDLRELRRFYIRRTLRIFPLYYGYLLMSVGMGAAVSVWYWFYLQSIASGLRLPIHGPGHFWSLAVEEQFYLAWPFLVLFLPRRWLAGAMWAAIGFSLVVRVLLLHTGVDSFYFTVTRLDGLAAGGLLALYYRRGWLADASGLLGALAALSVAILGAQWWLSHGDGVAWVQVTKFTSAALLYASLIGLILATSSTGGASRRSSPAHALLRLPPLRAVGRVSYGMYVFHPAIFGFLPPFLGRTPLLLKAIFCFLCVYGVSFASFYGFERRFTGMKERFAPEPSFQEA
jgi:peptidoglycan/LPS O-acetylase OafA/YrhL